MLRRDAAKFQGDERLEIGSEQSAIPHGAAMLCAVSLVGLCYAGSLKGSPLLNWLPFDATAFFFACCLASWALYIIKSGGLFVPSMRWHALLWYGFLPGAVLAVLHGFELTKLAFLFTTTLLCVLLPALITTSPRAKQVWLVGQVVVGSAFAIGILVFPKVISPIHEVRLDIEGGGTITTARALGSAVIVLLTLVVTSGGGRRPMWLACWVAALSMIALMLIIGSRGPFISVVIAIPLVLLTGRLSGRVRVAGVFVVLTIVVLPLLYVGSGVSSGTTRIFEFLSGEGRDPARNHLYAVATEQIFLTPQGLGWGGFGNLTSIRASGLSYPHNIFLEIFAEGGWLAGCAFVVYVVVSLARLRFAAGLSRHGLAFYGLAVYWLLAAQFSGDVVGNRLTWASLAFGFVEIAARPIGLSLRSAATAVRNN